MSTQTPTAPEIMIQGEAADYLRVSPQTIKKLRMNKVIRAKKVGRQWRYLKEDLDRYMRDDDEHSNMTE